MAAIFLHLLTLLMVGTFSTRMWALPHRNRKLSLPKWVFLPLSSTPGILYSASRFSMYLFFPSLHSPQRPNPVGVLFFYALVVL